MLPNWLYGKSKSKLASILGGGGGIPEDYNQVKAQVAQNAEDILTLSDSLDSKAALTQITNPNILHNPWFQVNQRNAVSLSSTGYFVDRWIVSPAPTGSSTFTLNSDGTITIDNSLGEAPCYFIQRRTAKTVSRIAGRIVTASIMLSDGTVRSGSGAYVDTATKYYYEDDDIILQSSAQSSGQFFVLRVKAGKSITIKALKLEVGEVSTLAMDPRPEYALELAKCQRYFRRFLYPSANSWIAIGQSWSANKATFPLPFVQMRATPNVVPSNISDWKITSGVSTNKPHELSAMEFSYGGLTATTDDSTMDGTETFNLRSKVANAYIDFDAEL